MSYDKQVGYYPVIQLTQMLYDKQVGSYLMTHIELRRMFNSTQWCTPNKQEMAQVNILFRLCMQKCMVCVACSYRNICTKYSSPLLCWVGGPMRKVGIKARG
jgi:hypothetical protein